MKTPSLSATPVTNRPPGFFSNHLKQLLGIGFAALFLWLAFRGIDLGQFLKSIQAVQPLYVLLLFVSGIASHVLRAWRWQILLRPLSSRHISLWNLFCALMVCYAVNVVIPRGGEIARLVSISRSEKLPWAGVLPTIFIDRLLDVALLMLVLGVTLVCFPTEEAKDLPWLVPGGAVLSLVTLVGLIMLPRMADIINWLFSRSLVRRLVSAQKLASIKKLAEEFHEGTRCLHNPFSYPVIAFLSLSIWFCYWLNFYFMIWAFGLNEQVSAVHCLVVFAIGSVGVLVPTPGNVGSFHFLVSQGLMMISGVDREMALAFASLLHLMCFVVVTCIPAAVCVAIQSIIAPASQTPDAGSPCK
ncbi:MAG: flippase-like domain-containing protein [Candidatus Melainabacteria bacterium]|nr:flippase-like domain-containing protein [Candidatus Melainabacteria bacterium]